jgi:hypothetical protein
MNSTSKCLVKNFSHDSRLTDVTQRVRSAGCQACLPRRSLARFEKNEHPAASGGMRQAKQAWQPALRETCHKGRLQNPPPAQHQRPRKNTTDKKNLKKSP